MSDSIADWFENLHATLDAVDAPREPTTSGRISMLAAERKRYREALEDIVAEAYSGSPRVVAARALIPRADDRG